FSQINMEVFHLFTTLTANEPLRAISERLYYQTTRIWLKMASRLKGYETLLYNEFVIFQREVADITEAVEHGDLMAAGHVRRAHIAMSFSRIRQASGAGEHAPGPKADPSGRGLRRNPGAG